MGGGGALQHGGVVLVGCLDGRGGRPRRLLCWQYGIVCVVVVAAAVAVIVVVSLLQGINVW